MEIEKDWCLKMADAEGDQEIGAGHCDDYAPFLGSFITDVVKKLGGLRATARALDVDAAYLCRVRDGKKNPSDSLLKKLGLKRITIYVRV